MRVVLALVLVLVLTIGVDAGRHSRSARAAAAAATARSAADDAGTPPPPVDPGVAPYPISNPGPPPLTTPEAGYTGTNSEEEETVQGLMIWNADIYNGSVRGAAYEVTAMGIENGRIVIMGTYSEVDAWAATFKAEGGNLTVLNAGLKLITPGLIDSHAHPLGAVWDSYFCVLNDATTKALFQSTLLNYSNSNPQYDMIYGSGWDTLLLKGIDKSWIDDITEITRPVFLRASDGHTAVVNTAALDLAGLTADSPNPTNGYFDHYDDGELNGIVRENSALAVFDALLDPVTNETLISMGKDTAIMCHTMGITAVTDARTTFDLAYAYWITDLAGVLPLHVQAQAVAASDESIEDQVAEWAWAKEKYSSTNFGYHSIKIFMDGLINGYTACLIDAYEPNGDNVTFIDCGFNQTFLNYLIANVSAQGWQVHGHACGDLATNYLLNSFEYTKNVVPDQTDLRHVISHMMIVAPTDIPRFGELGVTANCQFYWAQNSTFTDELIPFIGTERLSRLYPYKKIDTAGGRIVAGSDYPVTDMYPWYAMTVALTRQWVDQAYYNKLGIQVWDALDGCPGNCYDTIDEVLPFFMENSAWLQHAEEDYGTLEVGKLADFVVWEYNTFYQTVDNYVWNYPKCVYFEGDEVYGECDVTHSPNGNSDGTGDVSGSSSSKSSSSSSSTTTTKSSSSSTGSTPRRAKYERSGRHAAGAAKHAALRASGDLPSEGSFVSPWGATKAEREATARKVARRYLTSLRSRDEAMTEINAIDHTTPPSEVTAAATTTAAATARPVEHKAHSHSASHTLDHAALRTAGARAHAAQRAASVAPNAPTPRDRASTDHKLRKMTRNAARGSSRSLNPN